MLSCLSQHSFVCPLCLPGSPQQLVQRPQPLRAHQPARAAATHPPRPYEFHKAALPRQGWCLFTPVTLCNKAGLVIDQVEVRCFPFSPCDRCQTNICLSVMHSQQEKRSWTTSAIGLGPKETKRYGSAGLSRSVKGGSFARTTRAQVRVQLQ